MTATPPTARALAREQINRSILEEARRQLAVTGPAALSLRAIARELGMVSSAVYRYVASRDELLTRMIVAAYDSLGDAVEAELEAAVSDPPAERWVRAALAVRDWAIANPHEYALLYGTPVPGYAAPETTVAPGTRVVLALIGIVRDAHRQRALRQRRRGGEELDPGLADELERLAGVVELDLPPTVVLDVLTAWTQLFGLLTFELTNQTRGVVDDHRALFEAAARRMATHIGLRS